MYLRAETTGRPSDLCGAIIPIRLHETGCHTESVLKSLPLYDRIDLRLAEKVVKKKDKKQSKWGGTWLQRKALDLEVMKSPETQQRGD